MGRVTATITVTNHIDEILGERGFIPPEQIRSITIDNVLVDTGATRLCLPADIISQLGLTLVGEIQGNTAIGARQFRLFKDVSIAVAGREGRYDCVELPAGEEPLLGLIPLEDLGLEPDLRNQRLNILSAEGNQSYIRV
ncbi:MAG: aspartyl protease [Microcoleus sp. PH2017_10_PVI_O_A]|uniref:aspartyl protease family protein n=1 Tax=unclassified Microcoleus TaxID=2642155 RepID=UPI001D6A4763|nr:MULTISPECIES: aspartyl protease family protein [unclassified Microcoleus]TAE83426.1 MAG: aspartyl protease [Oscillatoriales cyanobacterium]MCC3404550.1 aspartyl protease [Microcoleus sp. PH2017_10_PVI_O_A]MCC3458618.1 aspartyl protease [Microcoleus sp. PH2017_11_PCY_U_A]MCC3476868.1 aspartyl protease [Microcoleus sp. PH2017_12_PCY_D_A]MCC3559196.1 aspartyl protease [Microcoleus sp. PH2017_27_LUM_O_A]